MSHPQYDILGYILELTLSADLELLSLWTFYIWSMSQSHLQWKEVQPWSLMQIWSCACIRPIQQYDEPSETDCICVTSQDWEFSDQNPPKYCRYLSVTISILFFCEKERFSDAQPWEKQAQGKYLDINIWYQGTKRIDPGSSQCSPVIGPGILTQTETLETPSEL